MKTRETVYNTILNKLFNEIESGTFRINQRLPSERDLAEILSISRGSLREVLRVLEQQGVVETRQDGRYLIRNDLRSTETQQIGVKIENARIAELLEARSVLEDKIVDLACIRASESDINQIRRHLEKGFFELNTSLRDAALDYDNLFHIAIANAAHNSVFTNIYIANLEILQSIRRQSLASAARRKEIIEEHNAIYQAIANRDSLMARLSVRIHLRSIERRYLNGDIDFEL